MKHSNGPDRIRMDTRRVSLPVSLRSQFISINQPVPSRFTLSPPAPRSPCGRRSLPTTPHVVRRSLPGTPRSPVSPRALSPRPFSPRPYSPRNRMDRLPDVDEHFPTCSSSSSSETSPRRILKKNNFPRYQYSLRDSGYMEHQSSKDDDGMPSGERPEGQLRSFGYKKGAVVDNGYENKGVVKHINRHKESRRATCPEIWLAPDAKEPSRGVVLRVYGTKNTGKKTLAHQIHHYATTTSEEQILEISSESEVGGAKQTTFLLNGSEIAMEILMESALEASPFESQLTVFLIVYNVDSRDSFLYAAQILNRIVQTRNSDVMPVLLVGNKIDLKRNQVVSTIEGRSLAKIYKTGFVEVSALLSVNMDSLWREVLKQLETPPPPSSWVDKMLDRGRTFAKSCEEIVQKIITA